MYEPVVDLKELVKKRGIIKGKLTLFVKYLNAIEGPLSAEKYIDLQLRYSKITKILVDYENIQDLIETACTDYEVQLQEREAFENNYYTNVSLCKKLMQEFENSKPQTAPPSSNSSDKPHSNSVKLPEIKLPTFDGNATNWLEFRDQFDAVVNDSNIKPILKLKYLRGCLTGSALNVISSLDYCEESYAIAWRLLCERYNNPKVLVTNHLRELLSIETIQSTPSALRTLVDNLSKHLRTLNKLSVNTENWDVILIFLLSSKLDKFLHRKWEEKTNSRELPNLQDFKSFLRAQADLLESLGSDRPDEQPEANGTRKALVIASSPGHGTSPKPSPKPKAHAVPAATAASTGLLAKMVSRLHRDPTTTYQVAELEGPSSLRGHDGGGEG
ncbi:unnamed protein product [Parnassius apollo]|uniref:(apollo) hypothetical protein n=1 Tax=Parnassius apollo TaxID=110799 RepID=A0A8S3XAE8_PARAO|nr:unnamed protein product [Parnassius apollo]